MLGTMLSVNEQARRRPGPKPTGPPKEPSGYRITELRRRELRMAGLFTGKDSLQEVIDAAVDEFLDRVKARRGFNEALASAEASLHIESGVTQLHTTGDDGRDGGVPQD